MSNIVIASWAHQPAAASSEWVYPDGCRDLIMRLAAGNAPKWYLTVLDTSARTVASEQGEYWAGFRLHPAAVIDEPTLLTIVQGRDISTIDIPSVINDCALVDSGTHEALNCLSRTNTTVKGAAAAIGVSERTLQRKLMATTQKSPIFWLSLARARKVAASFAVDEPLAQIAAQNGYSDQAHLTREMRRWFCRTPAQMRKDRRLLSMISQAGFATQEF